MGLMSQPILTSLRIRGPSLEGVESSITRAWGPEPNHQTLVLFRVRILRVNEMDHVLSVSIVLLLWYLTCILTELSPPTHRQIPAPHPLTLWRPISGDRSNLRLPTEADEGIVGHHVGLHLVSLGDPLD